MIIKFDEFLKEELSYSNAGDIESNIHRKLMWLKEEIEAIRTINDWALKFNQNEIRTKDKYFTDALSISLENLDTRIQIEKHNKHEETNFSELSSDEERFVWWFTSFKIKQYKSITIPITKFTVHPDGKPAKINFKIEEFQIKWDGNVDSEKESPIKSPSYEFYFETIKDVTDFIIKRSLKVVQSSPLTR